MQRSLFLVLGLCSLALTGAAAAAPVSRDDPESSDPGRRSISTATGSAVVVTANPLASAAALDVLAEGGTAADALVSAQAVLAVVEPQSSGLAGGGFQGARAGCPTIMGTPACAANCARYKFVR